MIPAEDSRGSCRVARELASRRALIAPGSLQSGIGPDLSSAVRPPGDLVSVSRELSVRPPGVSAVRRQTQQKSCNRKAFGVVRSLDYYMKYDRSVRTRSLERPVGDIGSPEIGLPVVKDITVGVGGRRAILAVSVVDPPRSVARARVATPTAGHG